MLGVGLMGAGQILSSFSQDTIGALFVTAGLMMGYGIRLFGPVCACVLNC